MSSSGGGGETPLSPTDQIAFLKTIDQEDGDDGEFKSPATASQESTKNMLEPQGSEMAADMLEVIPSRVSSRHNSFGGGGAGVGGGSLVGRMSGADSHNNNTHESQGGMKRVGSRAQIVFMDTEVDTVGTDTLPEQKSYHGAATITQLEFEQKVEDALGIEHLPSVHVDEPIHPLGAVSPVPEELVDEPEPEAVHFAPVIPAPVEQSWTTHSEEVISPIRAHVSELEVKSNKASPILAPIPSPPEPATALDNNSPVAVASAPAAATDKYSIPNVASKSSLHSRNAPSNADKSEDGKSRDFVSHGVGARFEFHVRVGHYGIQGRRMTMEDQHTQLLHPEFNRVSGFKDNIPRSFFAVFDGHGGPSCAQFCSRTVHKFMVESKEWHPRDDQDVMSAREEALKEGIRMTDADFCQRLTSHGLKTSSGSTAVVAYIEEDTLIVANVGDSRAILCCDGKAIALTSDHKPNRPDEQERIISSGGFVGRTQIEAEQLANSNACDKFLIRMLNFFRLYRYPYRVYPGGLAVSRSIGDLEIKHSGLIVSEPETIRRRLTVNDEFLILACDGFWDVITNDQAVQLVRDFRSANGNHPTRCAKHLVFEAYRRNSTDNISAICVFFSVTE